MEMEPYMLHAELKDIAIKTALDSITLRYVLVSSAATMFPFLLQISLGMISDPLSNAYRHMFPKIIGLMTVLIADLVFALALCPFSNFKLVPALFGARVIFLFCSCIIFISSYPCKAWTSLWMNTIIGLFSAGQVLSSVGAFAPDENIYSIILIFTLICRIASALLYCWRLHLWMKYLSTVKMRSHDYMAVSFMTILISVSLGGCWLNIIFSYQHWYNTSATFLISTIVITSFLVTLFIILNEIVFSHEITAMQMSQALKMKRMLVRYFSHQLRTPLNTVSLGLTLMAKKFEKYNDTDMNDVLEDATQSCKLTLQVLDNILLYEKLESNMMTILPKKVMLQPLVQNLTNMIQFQTKEKGINLITEISQNTAMIDPEEVYLLADNNKLNQVLLTILSNAIKYTKARGRVTISLVYTSDLTTSEQIQDARRKEIAVGRVSIVVTDTGCGIAPNRLATLFSENIQFDVGQEETHKGSGLSLWIAKRIVDLHPNMSLEVTSQGVDCGSSFTLSLPFYLSCNDKTKIKSRPNLRLAIESSSSYDGMRSSRNMNNNNNNNISVIEEPRPSLSRTISSRALTRIDAPDLRRLVNGQTERSFRKRFSSVTDNSEGPVTSPATGGGSFAGHPVPCPSPSPSHIQTQRISLPSPKFAFSPVALKYMRFDSNSSARIAPSVSLDKDQEQEQKQNAEDSIVLDDITFQPKTKIQSKFKPSQANHKSSTFAYYTRTISDQSHHFKHYPKVAIQYTFYSNQLMTQASLNHSPSHTSQQLEHRLHCIDKN
eukprot:gene5924-11953_t